MGFRWGLHEEQPLPRLAFGEAMTTRGPNQTTPRLTPAFRMAHLFTGASVSVLFAGYRFDPGARQLFRGTVEVHLSPKAFDLLQILVEHHTRAVSKAELHQRLWPGTFVSDANVTSLVNEARRALGDRPNQPQFIRTVHRYGYAFCAPITGPAAAAPAASTCWLVWKGREIPLSAGEHLIGRDRDAPIQIDAPSVSRRHARITVSPASVSIEDLGSKNGTLVRNRRVTRPVELADLDELQIGSARLTVRILRGAEPTQTMGR